MKINKQAFELIGVTLEDYLEWCKSSKKPSYATKTKVRFFELVKSNQIVRDKETCKLKTLNSNNSFVIK